LARCSDACGCRLYVKAQFVKDFRIKAIEF
jgi:hypothetical protein